MEPCPLSSQVPKTVNNPTPSSSYFIETRYFSKVKALRRVDSNTLKKQEDSLGARREGGRMRRGERTVYFWGRKTLSTRTKLFGRSLQPEFSEDDK